MKCIEIFQMCVVFLTFLETVKDYIKIKLYFMVLKSLHFLVLSSGHILLYNIYCCIRVHSNLTVVSNPCVDCVGGSEGRMAIIRACDKAEETADMNTSIYIRLLTVNLFSFLLTCVYPNLAFHKPPTLLSCDVIIVLRQMDFVAQIYQRFVFHCGIFHPPVG